MSSATIGLFAGLLIGVASFIFLSRAGNGHPLVKAVAVADLVVMPAIGWAIGAYVFEGAI